MKPKRYRVETLHLRQEIWKPEHYTDSLPVAKRYIAAVVKSQEVWAVRVVDQVTEKVVSYDQA